LLKLTKYISKESWLKLGLFLVLLVAAGIYDNYHHGNPAGVEQTKNATEKGASLSGHFFCTLQGPVSMKAPIQKIVLKRSLQEKLSRFLVVQLKARMAFLLKAEVREQPQALLLIRILSSTRYSHQGSPDDQPPLS